MASRKTKTKPSRRKKGNSPKRRKVSVKAAPLLVVDQKPILKKALTQCRRLRTELHKKQARLRRFEEEEIAAYQAWISANFGAELTEARELREQMARHEFVLENLSACELWMPERLQEVYEELMRRLEDGTLYEFQPPQPDDASEDDAEDEVDDPFEDFKQAFEEAFDDFFDEDGMEEEDEEAAGRFPGKPASRKGRQPEEIALKALYRALAKRLHPDHSELEGSMRARRWNELQTAYQNCDLHALQRIEAVCDMDTGGLSIRLGLARLRDLAAYHKSHLRPIREALREAKRHPAFGFAESDEEQLRRDVAAELGEFREQLSERLDWLQEEAREIADIVDEDAIDEDDWADLGTLFSEMKPRPRPRPRPKSTKSASRHEDPQMNLF